MVNYPPQFVKWPKIEAFKSVVHKVTKLKFNNKKEDLFITFRPKPKLHGTNAAIRIYRETDSENGFITVQSRNRVLTINTDNYGFANWVLEAEDDILSKPDWSKIPESIESMVVYGEWCGKGIQDTVAISEAPKGFHVFAVAAMTTDNEQFGVTHDPASIIKFMGGLDLRDDVHVLPWIASEITMNFSQPQLNGPEIDSMNSLVKTMDEVDLYTRNLYGIEGPGEGFVYYPTHLDGDANAISVLTEFSDSLEPLSALGMMMFKVKTEAHRTTKSKEAVEVDFEELRKLEDLLDTIAPDARMEQFFKEIEVPIIQNIGDFIRTVVNDAVEECSVEIEMSGLDLKKVKGKLGAHVAQWYKEKIL